MALLLQAHQFSPMMTLLLEEKPLLEEECLLRKHLLPPTLTLQDEDNKSKNVMKNSLKNELSKLIKVISYDTSPDPPCSKFCKDYKECQNQKTICLYRKGHHIFHWGDITLRHNVCKCPSVFFEKNF